MGLHATGVGVPEATLAGALLVLGLRLAALRWKISLPLFETNS